MKLRQNFSSSYTFSLAMGWQLVKWYSSSTSKLDRKRLKNFNAAVMSWVTQVASVER
jgi:hypothetical protein